MPPTFNWTTFLLGFAIALWIAIVLLFVLPAGDRDDDAACPTHGCCGGCWGPPRLPIGPLWIPDGPLPYFCASTDNGGGYIEDNGGGYIEDNGGANVEDSSPRVLAPLPPHLDGIEREKEEFACSNNDNGGGYIEDANHRIVAVPILKSGGFKCWSRNGNAIVLNSDNERVSFDRLGNLHVHTGNVVTNPMPVVEVDAPQDDDSDYNHFTCMVGSDLGNPFIVTREGVCATKLPGTCPE